MLSVVICIGFGDFPVLQVLDGGFMSYDIIAVWHWLALQSAFSMLHSLFMSLDIIGISDQVPNKSPEPTAVGAAVAIPAASRRWLSFFR